MDKSSASYRNSHQGCSIQKGALKNFAKFTGKHLCQNHFLINVAGLNTFLTEHLWTTASVVENAKPSEKRGAIESPVTDSAQSPCYPLSNI